VSNARRDFEISQRSKPLCSLNLLRIRMSGRARVIGTVSCRPNLSAFDLAALIVDLISLRKHFGSKSEISNSRAISRAIGWNNSPSSVPKQSGECQPSLGKLLPDITEINRVSSSPSRFDVSSHISLSL